MGYGITGMLLAAVSILAAAQELPFTPPPNIPGQSAWIPVRHQSQELNLCGPTSASMVLDYFGVAVGAREIKALSRSKTYRPGDEFTDFTPTSDLDLLRALRRLGYKWPSKSYPLNESGFWRGVWDIERSLDKGLPVLIDTTLYAGHTYVVTGYSAPNQTIIVVDPASEKPGVRAVRLADLIWIWKDGDDRDGDRWAVFSSRPRATTSASR